MKVVATTIIIPDYVKWLILYAGIGFLIFRVLYKYIVINQVGVLSFASNAITIATKKKIYQILVVNISRIELIDPSDLNEMPRGKFYIVIHQYNYEILQFRLKEYYDSDSVVDNLLKYDNLSDRIENPERLRGPDIIDP